MLEVYFTVVFYHCNGKLLMYGGSNTENITRVYLAIRNVSRKMGWMNWLYCENGKTGIVYGLFG